MICKAVIKRIEKLDEYQGDLLLEVNNAEYFCYYQTNEDFSDSYFYEGKEIEADIRVNCGDIQIAEYNDRPFYEIIGNTIKLCGKVIGKEEDTDYYKIDCGGFVIEAEDSSYLHLRKPEYKIGEKVKYKGSLQIYFPGTEWSFEKIH